jgi:hypothetical protein
MVYLATDPQVMEEQFDSRLEAMFEVVGYKPWPEQAQIIYCNERFIVVTGGEQGGKSIVMSKMFLARWPRDMEDKWDGEHPLIYWLVGPDYANTQAEFDYIRDDFVHLFGEDAVRASKRVDPGYIEVWFTDEAGKRESRPRIRVETKSGTDPRKITRIAPIGIIGCEASQLDLETFERLRGRTAPRKAWLLLSGTLEGSLGWYPTVAEAWKQGQSDRKSFELPSWTNKTLYPGGRNDPEILSLETESSDSYFMERIAGKRVPPRGLVFGEFRPDIHIADIDWVPGEPVTLWVDPGYAGAHAVEASQQINGQEHVFDEIYERDKTTEDIIKIVQERAWWKDVREGVIDLAGYQHQAMAAPAEIWQSQAGLYMSAQRIREAEGRERLKTFLIPNPLTGMPKIVFALRCKGVLSEFGVVDSPLDHRSMPYRWKTDREGNIVGQNPEDKNNHGIKAVIYGIVDRHGYAKLQNRSKFKVTRF